LLRTIGLVTCDKSMYVKMGRCYQLSDEELAVMNEIVSNNLSIFLDKLQCKMENLTVAIVAKLTIWKELHKQLGLTLHKSHAVRP
ncbi:hypothetical protein CROQUDRAFT_18687, partial [Cronartium quercuum f. sp. fusiforme G11]